MSCAQNKATPGVTDISTSVGRRGEGGFMHLTLRGACEHLKSFLIKTPFPGLPWWSSG